MNLINDKFWKIIDWFKKRKEISGQFISNNTIWTLYFKRVDKEYVFYLSSWFKKYRLTFFDFSSLKNKRLIDDLLIYFEQEREGFTNWKWLVLDYYSVGRTNQPFKMFDRPI